MILHPVKILPQLLHIQRGIPGAPQIYVKHGSLRDAALISPAFRPALLPTFSVFVYVHIAEPSDYHAHNTADRINDIFRFRH